MNHLFRKCLPTLLVAAMLAACSPQEGEHVMTTESGIGIESVSAKPWLVTDGNVLLRLQLDPGVDAGAVRVSVNGADVSARFRPAEEYVLLGLIEGLQDGSNLVEAWVGDTGAAVGLELTSYPVTGPIISGPHQQPFFCETHAFTTVAGDSLGEPLDSHCSVATRIDYVYLSTTGGEFKPFPTDATSRPADLDQVALPDGRQVPFIVRVETGTVNRAIYEVAMLHDPAQPQPDPWTHSAGWNGKLVYTHGGGCRQGWYRQGDSTGGVLREGLLEMGYALISSSLNVFGQNCNDLLASETHIMVKERFVETYGEPVYTIATGASGGSYQSHQTADNYPGVFDGIIVSSSFPDVTSATIFTLADARLLHHYFTEVSPDTFSAEQQLAISGFGQWGSIPNLSQGAARMDPVYEEGIADEQQGGEVGLPELESLRMTPSNPDGLRATVYEHTRNVYGSDPVSGHARRPLDNRGVQYGLDVLNRGGISSEQFIALNRDIGGFDSDLNHVPERHVADPNATRLAFASGRILSGGAGLATTPVIDYRSYTDDRPNGDIHMIVHQFTTRARLEAANGHADNHVMAVGGAWGFTQEQPDLGILFTEMDRWLTGIQASGTGADLSTTVVAAKPAALVDVCWDNRDGGHIRIEEPQRYAGNGLCQQRYRAYPTPRQVAGAPLRNDIVSCRLKPLDLSDYTVSFTEQEMAALRDIFPDGVCDWSQGDAHSKGHGGTWSSFGPSPVNQVR
ncbi:MAG: DUF6351 family protein [Gammaproteobacteria bacterium]|nr:DUF6351 family protein [Gammaproteobacteria bacterium]MDP2348565.1 DUF6351 family protein [Gammaproteobacteria bacterium]